MLFVMIYMSQNTMIIGADGEYTPRVTVYGFPLHPFDYLWSMKDETQTPCPA